MNLKNILYFFKAKKDIKKNIKRIIARFTNSNGIWSFKGILAEIREYYSESNFDDEILLKRMSILRNNVDEGNDFSNIFVGIVAGLVANEIGWYKSTLENLNKTIDEKVLEIESIQHIAQINQIKITANIMFLLLIATFLFCITVFIKFAINILKKRNVSKIYLEQKELEIIMDVLEGKKELT